MTRMNSFGIITERDIVRKCFVRGKDFINKKITDIMTKQVVIAALDDDLDYAIDSMKKAMIRHIPIADGKRVAGIISMRDILGFRYEETQSEIKYMQLLPKRPTFK
jgi:CBS domain-containing protein